MGARQICTTCRQASMTSASQNIVAFPRAEIRRSEHEIAFLPAALEITESPPSPIGRAIGASIIAVFSVALVWASLDSVDIVATAGAQPAPMSDRGSPILLFRRS